MSKGRCGSRARRKERKEEEVSVLVGARKRNRGTARPGGCRGRRGGGERQWEEKNTAGPALWMSTRCGPTTPIPGQWPGHCQGLTLSYRGCVPRRHSRESRGKERKGRRGSASELLLCAGPRARQFTDSISFNHHNNRVRKESRLPVSSEEMEAQSKTIFPS